MINTYTFYKSDVNKLNTFVLAFFNSIEKEKGAFSNDFFEKEFYDNLVSRHRTILRKTFKDFYETIRDWEQEPKTALIQSIRVSNQIKQICAGEVVPSKKNDIPEEVRELLLNLFKKLYKDVLFGDFFKEHYGNRKEHYHSFRQHDKNGYSYCPACGIWPMHNWVEDITDQYDHYLAKDIYPFSSVNFENLVPVCSDCNSLAVKSNTDILKFTGTVFYPFDITHQPIKTTITIGKNALEMENVEWEINYSCEKGKDDELTAWKSIYDIEKRHKNHLKGNIKDWTKNYWEFFNDKESIEDIADEQLRTKIFLKTKRSNQFEYQGLSAFLTDTYLRAMSLSRSNSRY